MSHAGDHVVVDDTAVLFAAAHPLPRSDTDMNDSVATIGGPHHNRTTTTTTTNATTTTTNRRPDHHHHHHHHHHNTNHPNNSSNSNTTTSSPWTSTTAWKLSRYYCWWSAVGALCAILVAAPPSPSNTHSGGNHNSFAAVTTPIPTSSSSSSLTSTCSSSSSSSSSSIFSNALSSLTTTTSNNNNNNNNNIKTMNDPHPECPLGMASDPPEKTTTISDSTESGWWRRGGGPRTSSPLPNDPPPKRSSSFLQALSFWKHEENTDMPGPKKKHRSTASPPTKPISSSMVSSMLQVLLFSWLDPNLTFIAQSHSPPFPFDTIITNLIDKVLTSTIRLILIANWLIALTVLLHTAVADYFLGADDNSRRRRRPRHHHPEDSNTTTSPPPPVMDHRTTTTTTTPVVPGRERMGGYLLFKFLLISAMVGPDTFDLLILLSWYTVLSFLRSLASLCIQQIDTCRLLLHRVPPVGVRQLLWSVLGLNVLAALTCIGLFHGAGYGMVLLLTGDCVLLALDTMSHIIQYYQSIVDVQHAHQIQAIDDLQMVLHYQLQQQRWQQQQQQPEPPTVLVAASATEMHATTTTSATNASSTMTSGNANEDNDDIEERSKDLDRQLDVHEQQHRRTTARIETMIFVLQFMIDILTILHFIHIWTLHGIHFTFIDGVIALHLHSSATAALKKVHDRRATYRIARDMDERFHNATEHDLQKAQVAGDVCCICLGTMHYFPTKTHSRHKEQTPPCRSPTGNVKKVACGHLYHTTCLREIIERARSIEAARCPLCRASLVPPHPERRPPRDPTVNEAGPGTWRGQRNVEPRPDDTATNISTMTTNHDVVPSDFPDSDGARPVSPVNAEDSIFRFTTEGLLPDWIPLPGFSFEIVRRPPPVSSSPTNTTTTTTTNDDTTANALDTGPVNVPPPDRANPPPTETSLFRRFMLLAGIVQMTPEEEGIALEQLIDMFPQYDRDDLRRALRQRGTIDAVVESILLGMFVGVSTEGG